MPIPIYLAMTSAEFLTCQQLPPKVGWMSCHFSPGGDGLCNLPSRLSPDSLLILDDSSPYQGHDCTLILSQLKAAAQDLNPAALLLDFQRPGIEPVQSLTNAIVRQLPCPVVVSSCYGAALDCPIFLPPGPLYQSLEDYLTPYQNREIWLDAAPGYGQIIVTSESSKYLPKPQDIFGELPHFDESLLCHYSIKTDEEQITFTFFRGCADLPSWLKKAETLGVAHAVGLYQELKNIGS